MTKTEKQLADIRQSILNETVSYEELAYLADHKPAVLKTGDILLAQWAGIDEADFRGRDNGGK